MKCGQQASSIKDATSGAKAPTLIERHPEFFDFAQDRL